MNFGTKENVAEVLNLLGRQRCAYGPHSKFCDCKYYTESDITKEKSHLDLPLSSFKSHYLAAGGETTGHCELMSAQAIINALTEDEYNLLIKRANKVIREEKPYRVVFHYNKQHNLDQTIPPWIVKSKGKTYYVHHFTSQVGFSTKETPENPHTKGSLQCVGFLHINQEGDSVVATVKEFPAYDPTKAIFGTSKLNE